MRALAVVSMVVCLVVSSATSVWAQPALTEPWPHGEEVSDIQQIGGTLLAATFGFGTGHALQGRWHERGWVFTLSQGVASGAIVGVAIGGMTCTRHCQVLEGVMLASMITASVMRIWEVYDAAVGPRRHNRRLYDRRRRAARGERLLTTPLVAPTSTGDGATAGIALRF